MAESQPATSYGSTNTGPQFPSIHSESPTVASIDCGKSQPISALRRTFCLLVLFDLIISVIFWIIFTEVKASGDIASEFQKQVIHYKFTESLFDIVYLSAFRFALLLVAYAIIRSTKPWFVAITTAITCVVMLVKVIEYKYDKGESNSGLEILDYLMMITPVVLSWVETWLLDLKVLPHEAKERERFLAAQQAVHGYTESSPLMLPRFLRSIPRPDGSYYATPEHTDTEDSDDDEVKSFHSVATSHRRTHSDVSQDAQYTSKILAAQEKAIELIESDGWVRQSGKDEVSGMVYAKSTEAYGKIFKLVAELDVDAEKLYLDTVHNAEDLPKWNPTVLEIRTLETIDDSTEISYNIAAEGGGGAVTSRDFVIIRHWEKKDDWYLLSSISVDYPAMPQQSKYVRGEQKPTLIRMKSLGENKLQFEWLLNTNLKGWLLQTLIDNALSGVMMSYLKNLRKHAATLT